MFILFFFAEDYTLDKVRHFPNRLKAIPNIFSQTITKSLTYEYHSTKVMKYFFFIKNL